MAEHEEANGNADTISALEKKIIKQVEFYFGDKNLPRDKFLRQKIEEDDGWVTFECLVTFNRLQDKALKNFTPDSTKSKTVKFSKITNWALTKDTDVIAKALRKSDGDIIEVSEDNKKVRRLKSKPVPENTIEARQLSKSKTVYCKGFPKETTLDELEEFFADKGKVIFILMRRRNDHTFKGSVFVEFANVEDVTAFLALEPEKLKFNDEEILRMSREDYYKKKEAERVQYKEDQKKEAQKKEALKKQEKEIKAAKKDEEKEETIKYESGCVLHFKSVGEQTSREDLKSLFGEHEDISWVNFTRGDTEGYIRFSKEGGAFRVVKALKETGDGKVVIRDVETTLRVLEGNEETDYWRKVQEDKMKARQKKAGKQGNRFGGGRGRDKRKASRRSEGENAETGDAKEPQGSHVRFDDGEPSPKKIKTEDS